MSVLRGLAALPPRRWPGLLHVAAVAVGVEVGLRVLRLPRLAALLGVPLTWGEDPAPPAAAPLVVTRGEAERLDAAVRVLAHPPFDGTCLRRALLLGHVLRAHRPRLRMGVSKDAGVVRAHAWVELDGVSLDPDDPVGYRPLRPLDRAAS